MEKENRNIIDYYWYWETDAIKADLNTKRFDYSIVCCNIFGDFNIGSIIRNSNAFLAKEVLIYGKNNWDRRGTVGTHLYSNLKNVKEIQDLEFLKDKDKYFVVGVDNVENSKSIETFIWPENKHIILVFGEEQKGIPKELYSFFDEMIYISQFGSVRSLNVGCASAIVMYDLVNKRFSK